MQSSPKQSVAWWVLLVGILQGTLTLITIANEITSFTGFALVQPWSGTLWFLSVAWVAALGGAASTKLNPNLWIDIATRSSVPLYIFQRLTRLAAACVPSVILILLGLQRAIDNDIGWRTTTLLVLGTALFWIMFWLVLRDGTSLETITKNTFIFITGVSSTATLVFAICALPFVSSKLPWVRPYTIVIARFANQDPRANTSDSILVNQFIINKMSQELAERSDIVIKPLDDAFESEIDARSRGHDYNAAIVIWGDYIGKQYQNTVTADVNVHIETLCLQCPIEALERQYREPRRFRGAEGFDIEVSLTNEFHYTSLFVLAIAERQAGHYASSVDTLTTIIDHRADFPDISDLQQSMVYYHRGLARDELKQSEEAEADVAKALSLDPNNPLAAHWYASILYNNKKYDESIRMYEQALQAGADRTCQYFFYNRGHAYSGLSL